ncbi:hypothetical protein LOTGIDRAFT_168574 [Lottia gigantea]|uniref:F-box domain-containing protein n=1 Tax=Lottia gigantea TaxID=225164 RepID=V4B7T3_LOTGI|nr:hypothetical protein LOTGIDRAFT_168574 [Lottia gigantea]ESO84704.1 hypothetical protein LOTGIDRAFT_168574 [Lottia gigantea]
MDNNKPAPSPEELREKRLAYFESKLSLPVNSTMPEKQSAKNRIVDKDVFNMKDPDKGKPRTTNSHFETDNASIGAVNGLDDIEAEFSRQDYRINSPLKQVKLKARRESFQSDSDFLTDVSDRIEEIHVVQPFNHAKSEQKLPEIDSKVPSLNLRDSQNLEAVSVFKSVADFEDLGLSTHRPSSPPSTISVLDKRLTAENSILDASDIKSLLGEDKYEEFLRKSVKDINALYQNKTTETSPHLLEGVSTVGPFTETEVSTEVTENHIVHNNFNTNHSKPVSNNQRHFPDDLSQISSSSVHNQIPSKNINDLEREHHNGQPRNYDQVLVSRNVTFSADEIYRQAYGGRFGPNQTDPRRSQQYSPNSGYYPPSPPYNVLSPRQQHYPGPMGMPPPNYQHIPPPNMMYNSHGEMFMSPPSPQNSYFQPYYPRQSPPSRTYMHPGSPGTSPPDAGIFSYPPPNYQQTMFNNMNMNNCNQYRMFVPRPPSQPHAHSPPSQSQNFDNHQGHPQYYPHNHYNKFAKNTNIQKEALSKKKSAAKPMAVLIKEEIKKDGNVKETTKQKDTSLRHKEAVRQYHEQRRNQQDDSTEEQSNNIKESQSSSYAASSLHRYFSSLENLQQKPELPRRNSLDDFRESSPESEVDNDNLTTVTGASEVTTAVGTDVTSATAMTAGGLTDHIEKLGITVPNLKLGDSKKTESASKSEKKVIICPECSAPNKDYMTWCGDCGEVLIGVQPVLAKKKKARPDKSKKSKNGLSVKQIKDNDVKNQGRSTDVKQTVSQAAKIKPSIKQFKEKAKQKFQVDPKEEDFSDESSGITESTISEVKAKFDPKFYRTEKDINEICDVITDPVIRGYIRTYFNQKTKSSLDKDRDAHGMDQDITDAFAEQAEPTTSKDPQDQPDEATPPEEVPESTEFSLDLNLSNTTTDMKQAAVGSPKPKGRPFGKKKDHVEIDIEVFGIEESREVKSTNSSVSVVPSLNLASSSSSEEEDEAKELNRQMMVDSSVESDVFQAVMEAKKSANGPVQIQPTKKDSFLAQILGPKTPKKATTNKLSPKQNKKVVQSKVAQSMNSVPFERKWEKSNLAWSAIQPREMNLKSSVSMPKAKLGFPNKKGVSVYCLENFGSAENMAMKSTDSSRKQRPASADLYRRKVQQQRPISAQPKPTTTAYSRPSSSMRPSSSHARPTSAQLRASTNKKSFTSSPVPLSLDDLENFDEDDDDVEMLDVGPPLVDNDDEVNMPHIVEHRLPAELPIKQPVVNLVPETSLSAYNKYHELQFILGLLQTPRIQVGDFSPWVCMPDEIWLHIFSYLSHIDLKNCGKVCRQFHRVALDEILWKCIAVKKQHAITDEWLDQISKRHPISLALIQCHGDLITSNGLKQMFKQCSHTLRELNFSRCSRGSLTGDSLLLHAAETCYNLTHIDASWCHVTDTGLSAIAQSSHSLRVLEMFGCFNINQRGLRFLANNCTNLYTLNLGQCYKLTDSCMTQISANLGRMENLDLRGCKQIRDACIRKIVRNCPRLKSLVLANCPNISDNAMVEVATYSMDIRNIAVCGFRNITDYSIRNTTNVNYILVVVRVLMSIDVCGCRNITDYSKTDYSIRNITNMNYILVVVGILMNIDVCGCRNITDYSIRNITNMNYILVVVGILMNIDVCGCRNITDYSIRNITNNCQRLTSLDISSTGCTSRSVNMLANYGNRCLETVKLNFLTDITDTSLIKLVKHCSKLKTLHLYGCSSVRNIHQLIAINPKLDVES